MYIILAMTKPKKKDQTKTGYCPKSNVITLARDKILIAIPVNSEAKKPRLYWCQTFLTPSFLRVLKKPRSSLCMVDMSSS